MMKAILNKEMENFKRKYTLPTSTTIKNWDSENLVLQVAADKQSLIDLLHNDRVLLKDRSGGTHGGGFDSNDLFNSVTRDIITISDAGTMVSCLNQINDIKLALGDLFYGALLIKDKSIINPLHPLIAMELLNHTHDTTIYKIIVYVYPDAKTKDSLFDTYAEHLADTEIIDSNINNLIKMYTNTVTYSTTKLMDITHSGDTLVVHYKVQISEGEDGSYAHYLIPNQVSTLGIVMPYYGTSLLKQHIRDQDVYGVNLSPMHSSNIANEYSMNQGTWKNNATEKPEVSFDSVCTGNSHRNNTDAGRRTLTHSNQSSPMTRDTICPGSLQYAAACVDKCLSIYILAGIIKEK